MILAPPSASPFVGESIASPRLRVEDPALRPDWDHLLSTHPQATFFHSAAWARTLSAAYGFRSCYVAAQDEGRLVGLWPVMEASSWLRGCRGVSLPFTDECSPLISEKCTAARLLDFATTEGRRSGWKYLELRGGHEMLESLPQSVSFYSHVLPLASAENEMLARCDSAVRRAVRKAERSGVEVSFSSDLDSLRVYYRLHCRTRSKHGAPPQPFGFFSALHQHALQAGHGFVALARYADRPIAGAVFLQFGRKVIYKFSASDERFQEFRGPNLVIWRSLQKLIAAGAGELNFGKTSLSNDGLRRFKLGWGAEEHRVSYARYSFATEEFVRVADLAAGAQRRLFALLPLVVSRCIGRAAYAHMS